MISGGTLLLLCLSPWGVPSPRGSPEKDVEAARRFFSQVRVVRLNLDLSPKEMDSLRREPRQYVKAKLVENGITIYPDVAVHLRGAAGSFRGLDDKPALTFNMDRFQPGQRFHGLDKWHLCNSVQDASYVSELICREMMRDAGIPASRISYAWVTINRQARGTIRYQGRIRLSVSPDSSWAVRR